LLAKANNPCFRDGFPQGCGSVIGGVGTG